MKAFPPGGPGIDLAGVRAALAKSKWTFAKSMPDNPHEYAVKKEWGDDDLFYRVVLFVRLNGYAEWWPDPVTGRCYVAMDIDGYHYWTMGDPFKTTWILNRKPVGTPPDGVRVGVSAITFSRTLTPEQRTRLVAAIRDAYWGFKPQDLLVLDGMVQDVRPVAAAPREMDFLPPPATPPETPT